MELLILVPVATFSLFPGAQTPVSPLSLWHITSVNFLKQRAGGCFPSWSPAYLLLPLVLAHEPLS